MTFTARFWFTKNSSFGALYPIEIEYVCIVLLFVFLFFFLRFFCSFFQLYYRHDCNYLCSVLQPIRLGHGRNVSAKFLTTTSTQATQNFDWILDWKCGKLCLREKPHFHPSIEICCCRAIVQIGQRMRPSLFANYSCCYLHGACVCESCIFSRLADANDTFKSTNIFLCHSIQ